MSTTPRAPRAALLALVVALIAVTVGAVTTSAAAPEPAADGGKRPARTDPGTLVGDGVEAAAADGPVEVIVSYDASQGLDRLAAAAPAGASPARRAAAAARAAAAYAEVKDEAVADAGDGIAVARDYEHLPTQVVRVDSPGALARLAAAPGVEGIHLPRTYEPAADSTANLALIEQPAVVGTHDGTGQAIAIIDTGLDYNLASTESVFPGCEAATIGTAGCRIIKVNATANVGGDLDVDSDNHGTQVSATAARVAPGARIAAYRVFTPGLGPNGPNASDDDILEAIERIVATDAAAHNIVAANLSLSAANEFHVTECGTSGPSARYRGPFLTLRSIGVVPVVAAGNDAQGLGTSARNGVSDPACVTGAVSVGAVYHTASDGTTSWEAGCQDVNPASRSIPCISQSGPLLSILAPGVNITSAGIKMSGTSQAAPHVAGAVAVLADAAPDASVPRLVRALTSTGDPITDPRPGAAGEVTGLLDLEAAVARVTEPLQVLPASTHPGCYTSALPASDEESRQVTLPFLVNFHGTGFTHAHVNQNGNLTFDGPGDFAYAPPVIGASSAPIIAPFFADVDTGLQGSTAGRVRYGTTTYDGHAAFCVTWDEVGYFDEHIDKTNLFQLLLVEREDVGNGNFDIVMKYDAVAWEAGDEDVENDGAGDNDGIRGYARINRAAASAGWSAGDGEHAFQFPGSRTRGGLLDANPVTNITNPTGLANTSTGTGSPTGTHVFEIRTAEAPTTTTTTSSTTTSSSTTTTTRPTTTTTDPGTPATASRVSDEDRVGTAIAASQSAFPTPRSAGAVVLASAENFPDGLAGTPLAADRNAPLLLTPRAALRADVLAEVQRVLPAGGTVYVLGGTAALAAGVADALGGAGFAVQRLAGEDRFGTAIAIADAIGSPAVALVATGLNFPDALAAGVAAAHADGVVVFTQNTTMHPTTASWLNAHSSLPVVIVGGTAAGTVPGAVLLSGADRFETAVKVADHFFTAPAVVGLASGVVFPDALSGGAHIAQRGGPILLTNPSALPGSVRAWLAANADPVGTIFVYGGPAAIADSVRNAAVDATR